MSSVTQRIKEIQQPYGGYLPIKSFSKEVFDDGVDLYEEENVHSSIVGLAVDYLTRFMLGDSAEQAFHISTLGANAIGMQSTASKLKMMVTGLDNKSIIAACKLSAFDVCFRSSVLGYKPIEDINPDKATIENIRVMVDRSLAFWEKYGPIISSEPTFEGGYSAAVNSGDGDFITQNAIWDFKVSKKTPTSKHTLQILMYYIMGLHSIHDCFKSIEYLGFFNPRLNIAYICPVSTVSKETISEIENEVICYNTQATKGSPPRNKATASKTVSKAVSKKATASTEVYYSVADISSITGQKKSAIYSAIRSGILFASKKGNKYVVSEEELTSYIEYVKKRQRIALITSVICGLIPIAILIIFLCFIF